MGIRLSKDATKISKLIYKEFKKTGNKNFNDSFIYRTDLKIEVDVTDMLDELEENKLIKTYNDYSFELQHDFLVLMENRLKDKGKGCIDTLSKIKPFW